jgi:TatD DNase family protein
MNTPKYFDAHTHIHFNAYKDDQNDVVKRALQADTWLVTVGTQKDTSKDAVQLAKKYKKGVYASVGLHPMHTAESYHDTNELGGGVGFKSRAEVFDYEYYKKLCKNSCVVAIGECGLDYFRIDGDATKLKIAQEDAFREQIRLAIEVKKTLVVHCRDAFDDTINILKEYNIQNHNINGLLHFFTGTVENARRLLDLGFYFSFGGATTFTSDYDEVVKFIPTNRMISETDAPYLTPIPHRGKRNEPMYVSLIAENLAKIKGESAEDFEKIKKTLVQNALTLFNISL